MVVTEEVKILKELCIIDSSSFVILILFMLLVVSFPQRCFFLLLWLVGFSQTPPSSSDGGLGGGSCQMPDAEMLRGADGRVSSADGAGYLADRVARTCL